MGKGLGIAALVIGIVSIFVPVVSLYIVWLALILAALAGISGDKTFSIATVAICFINVAFLSPATWMAIAGEGLGGGSFLKVGTVILFIAAIAAIVFGLSSAKKKQPPPSEA